MVADKKVLIERFFEEFKLVESNIHSFNHFIEFGLQEVIEENKEIEPSVIPVNIENCKIRFGKVKVKKPLVVEADGSQRELFPAEARLRKLSYSAPVTLGITLLANDIPREEQEIEIGKIPIMLKSKYCHLHGKNKEDLIKLGEDPDDFGGYFIINGSEKVVVIVEDLAQNNLLVGNNPTTGAWEGRLFSTAASLKIPHLIERDKEGKINLSFAKVKKIPFVVVLKALGMVKDQEISETIFPQPFDEVIINLLEGSSVKTKEEALDLIGRKLNLVYPQQIRVERVKDLLAGYFLPHLGTRAEDNYKKAVNLCHLIRKFIEVSKGLRSPDDKDHYMNKRLRLSGDLLLDLFRVNFKILVNDILYNFQRAVKKGKLPSLKSIVREKLLTQRLYSSMATGKWVGARQGIAQRLQRVNFLETLSALQRVVSPLSSSQENFEARALHCTSLGRLCPIETPEGTNIGLRKNLALFSIISQKTEEKEILSSIEKIGLKPAPGANGYYPVFLDYCFIGYAHDPQNFVKNFKGQRRKGLMPYQVTVYYNEENKEIHLFSSEGRALRPLIIVENGRPLLNEKHLQQIKGEKRFSWRDLIQQGAIEFLDAAEEENSLVAFDEKKLTSKHTHLEISSLALCGIATNLVPYANFNQSARLIIGSKNQKQAVSFYASNYLIRTDTDTHLLHYPQKPIVETKINKVLGFDNHPLGQNIILAVMCYGGYNLEDALIFNKAPIERGLGRSSYYRTIETNEIKYSGGLVDEICIPDKEVKGYRSEEDYSFLEEDGIVFPEAKVKEGNVVIGKVSPPRFLSGMEEFNLVAGTKRESSSALKHGESGLVDFVVVSEDVEGQKLVRVKLRSEKIPEIGDKFTSRHGQKGVIGLILPETDIPFSASGVVPDIIFSPFSLPSRMTVSHLLEAIAGKLGSLAARNIDSTIFEGEPFERIKKELLAYGFREDGSEVFYDGKTGQRFTARIFIGNIYYLRLKHLVSNKSFARARGPVQLLTRQPTEGKAKEGGLRLGEMEKDVLIAHGASLLLKERFDSDKTRLLICEKCGLPAVEDHYKKRNYCSLCGENVETSYIELSYAFKLLMDEIKSLGIYPKLILGNKY